MSEFRVNFQSERAKSPINFTPKGVVPNHTPKRAKISSFTLTEYCIYKNIIIFAVKRGLYEGKIVLYVWPITWKRGAQGRVQNVHGGGGGGGSQTIISRSRL